nr:hypothetical protein HK105_006045 [Polyrhizophydium stewartii]
MSGLKLPPIHPRGPSQSHLPSKLGRRLDGDKDDFTEVMLANHAIPQIIRRREVQEKYYLPCLTSHDYGWRWMPEERMHGDRVADASDKVDAAASVRKRFTVLSGPLPPLLDPAIVERDFRIEEASKARRPAFTLERFPSNVRGRASVFSWWGGCLESRP